MKTNNTQKNETSVLGAMYQNYHAVDYVTPALNANDFSGKVHRLIFEAMKDLARRGEPSFKILIDKYLLENDDLNQAGGLSYLASLVSQKPADAYVGHCVKEVRIESNLRKLEKKLCEARRRLDDGETPQAVQNFLDTFILS